MMYFLDTNTCIYFLKGTYQSIENRFREVPSSQIQIPVIVKAELRYGVEKSQFREKNRTHYEKFLETFEVAQINDDATREYARIRLLLEKEGSIIGSNDLLIAAIVLSNNGILVTHNTNEFTRVPGLKVEDWVRGS